MSWRSEVTRRAGGALVRGAAGALVSRPGAVRRHYLVDPDWRRVEDGYAARLDTRTTIAVAKPVGRWRAVDPSVPEDGWRAPWKAARLGLWASAVGVAWWLGASRGRGPLGSLAAPEDDHF